MSSDYKKTVSENNVKIGMAEMQGRRNDQEDCLMVAVDAVAEFPQLSRETQAQVLEETIAEMQAKHGDKNNQGSTACASTAWLDDEGRVNVSTANVGDSTAFLVILDGDKSPRIELLNQLHNPDIEANKAEYDRVMEIAKANQVELPFKQRGDLARLGSGLAMTRSIGDRRHEIYGVLHTPDITHKQVALSPGQKAFIVVACDGLTEQDLNDKPQVEERDIANIVRDNRSKDPKEIANDLIRFAYRKGSSDNISAAVFAVGKTPASAVIFDGHGTEAHTVSFALGKHFYPSLSQRIKEKLLITKYDPLERDMSKATIIKDIHQQTIQYMHEIGTKILGYRTDKKDLKSEFAKDPASLLSHLQDGKFSVPESNKNLQKLIRQFSHANELKTTIEGSKSANESFSAAKKMFNKPEVRKQLVKDHSFWGKIFQILGLTSGQKFVKFFDKRSRDFGDGQENATENTQLLGNKRSRVK